MSRTDIGPPVEQPTGVREAVRTLNPGYFALVMATGIVSLGMHYHRVYALSVALLWIACIAYACLVTMTVARVICFRREFSDDLTDPRRGFGMFTFVAATDVLGARLAVDAHYVAALALLALGWLTWLVLGYVVPWTTVLGHAARPVLQSANGTWF
ncbi:MAG: tellurite resistance protein permease, partial [Mycobacterium sp.]